MTSAANPIVLAFSGGLDTSFCVPWLKETYKRPVVTVTVNCGGIDAAAARALDERARALGAADHRLIEARPEFFDRVIKYLIMGNVRRGNMYPLSVGAERGLQAKYLAKLAKELGSDTVAHGCTAAGNDQVRFEIVLKAVAPRAHDLGARARSRVAAARAGQIPRGAQDARADARLGVLDEPRPLGRHDRRHRDARLEGQHSRSPRGCSRPARSTSRSRSARSRSSSRRACPSALDGKRLDPSL